MLNFNPGALFVIVTLEKDVPVRDSKEVTLSLSAHAVYLLPTIYQVSFRFLFLYMADTKNKNKKWVRQIG